MQTRDSKRKRTRAEEWEGNKRATLQKVLLYFKRGFAFFGLMGGFLQAQAGDFLSEVKLGAFYPSSKILRDTYSHSWSNYQAELTYTLFCPYSRHWWKGFHLWGSVNYLHPRGSAREEGEPCQLEIYPLAFGVKYLYSLPWDLDVYGSVGAKYFLVNITQRDDAQRESIHLHCFGSVIALGALFSPYGCLVIDLFADYSMKHFSAANFAHYATSDIDPQNLDISGLTFGIGLGFRF